MYGCLISIHIVLLENAGKIMEINTETTCLKTDSGGFMFHFTLPLNPADHETLVYIFDQPKVQFFMFIV